MKPFFMNVFRKKVNQTDFFSFLIALVLITLPFKFIINSISIGLLFLFSLLYFLKNRGTLVFKNNILINLITSVFILSVLSLSWSIDFEKTLFSLSNFLSFLLLPLSFYFLGNLELKKHKILNIFSWHILIVACYCLFFGFINYYNGSKKAFYYHDLSSNISGMNSIYLSIFTAFSILIVSFKEKQNKIDFLKLIILVVFLVLLSSKTVIIVTSLIVLCFVFFSKKKYLSKKNLLFLILIFFLVSKNVLERINIEFNKTSINEVLTKKEFNWDYIWSGTSVRVLQARIFSDIMFNRRVFYGYGLNASEELIKDEHLKYKLYSEMVGLNFHNQYLQITADLGLLGLLLLTLILLKSGYNAMKDKDILFLSFIILVSFVFLTESFLWRQRGMVFFIITILIFNKNNLNKNLSEN